MSSVVKGTIFGVVGFLILMGFFTFVGFKNQSVYFDKQISAQVENMEAKYNEYFLKVREIAKVPKEQMKQLKDLYQTLIEGRKSDGSMFKFISESNPEINQQTYVEIQRIISAGRADIYNIQKVHIDTVREYNTWILVFPNSIYAGFLNLKEKKPTVPLAENVSKIFESGVDREIEVF